jgi:hypothetical protein
MTAIECHLQVLRTPASPREWGEFGLNDCSRLQSVRHECGWRRCGHEILRPLQSGAPCLSAHRGGGMKWIDTRFVAGILGTGVQEGFNRSYSVGEGTHS